MKALRKEFWMEIRKSKSRFISILLIVALGVAFFSGIQASSPDMRYSGDAYYDESSLMDIKVVGTMGLTSDDVSSIESIDGIESAEGAWSTDVMCGEGQKQKVLHIESINDTVNKLDVQEGRLPEKSGEIFLDSTFASSNEYKVGDKVALREAVINAIVHNDYSFEVPPKFEIFPDRLEITSAGRLPESLTKEEFFNGISIPRNKELMRIYRDVELVESLGSGIPRILRAYGEDCFKFTDNFIRITLPISVQDGTQSAPSRHPVGTQSVPNIENLDKLIVFCTEARSFGEMLAFMGLTDRTKFRRKYIHPLLEAGILEQTIPNKPKSQNQKYCLTAKGIALKNNLTNNK